MPLQIGQWQAFKRRDAFIGVVDILDNEIILPPDNIEKIYSFKVVSFNAMAIKFDIHP